MRAAQSPDSVAIDELLRRHQDRIYALCRRVTGDDDAGLDATQEALIAITRGISRFDGRSSFSTWAYRVATNAALDEVRRRKRRPVPLSSDQPAFAVEVTADHGGAVIARIDVDAALASLPEDHRTAIVMRDLLDLDYDTIAEVLQAPVGTVKSRISRGRAALAEIIRTADAASGNVPGGSERPKVERGRPEGVMKARVTNSPEQEQVGHE